MASVQIDVRSLRSAQLQIELKKRGLSSSGKKSELRRRLEEALAKEKGEVKEKAEPTGANSNETSNVSNKLTTEQSTADKAVTMTTKDDNVTAPSSENKADDNSVKDKETVILTTRESTAPAVTQMVTQTKEDVPAEQISSNDKSQDNKVGKTSEPVLAQDTSTQEQAEVNATNNVQPTTEAAGTAEVSMEMDDLVVHTVDEDDFKMEEQSRDHVKRKSGEIPSSTTDEQGEVDSPSIKKRKIHLQGSAGATGTSSERKRKWKSSSSKSSATTISSDVLKKIIPDSVTKEITGETIDDVFPDSSTASHDPVARPEESAKPITMTTGTEDDTGEQERLRLAEEETRRRIEIRLREKQDGEQKQQQQLPLKPSDVSESDLTPNKEVIVDYNQPVRVRSPLANRNPPSCILHITNLVRPFALSQLKELLTEEAALAADGFWINKIKSHCFAVYENVDAAVATRNRLDGVKWPVTNPKVLIVDFSNEEEVVAETGGILTVANAVAMEHSDIINKSDITVKEKRVTKVEEKSDQAVVKEETVKVDEPSTKVEQEEGGAGAQEADNKSAVNRLDELFKKTTATPQIYWLPLTTEEGEKRLAAIKADEELRKQRREQRQKDREEKERLEQEEREKRRKAREEEREKRRRQRSTSRHRSRSRSKHRSRSRSRHRSHSRSRHQR